MGLFDCFFVFLLNRYIKQSYTGVHNEQVRKIN